MRFQLDSMTDIQGIVRKQGRSVGADVKDKVALKQWKPRQCRIFAALSKESSAKVCGLEVRRSGARAGSPPLPTSQKLISALVHGFVDGAAAGLLNLFSSTAGLSLISVNLRVEL